MLSTGGLLTEGWLRAGRVRDPKVKEAERKLVADTGVLGLARWEVASRRRRIVEVDEGGLQARAGRARPAVEAALSVPERVVAEQEGAVLPARCELAEASRQIAGCGAVGAAALGLSSAELGRFGSSWPRHPDRSPLRSGKCRRPRLLEP